MQSFLISLDSARTRRETSVRALEAARVPYTIIDAVDGRELPPETLVDFGREIVGTEQGCLASHIAALEAFLDSDASLGLILEDDIVSIDAAGLSAVSAWLGDRDNWDVAHLAVSDFGFRSPWGRAGGFDIDRAHLFPMTSPAQIWTRKGARDFLASSPRWPMDHAVRRWTLSRRSGVGLSQPLVRVGHQKSLILGRDAALTPAYLAKRTALRRRQKRRAVMHRLLWKLMVR